MALPSITYTIANGQTGDADKVMTNFNDIIAALTDGTKSLTIDALDVAGDFVSGGTVTVAETVLSDGYIGSSAKNVAGLTSTAAAGGFAVSSSTGAYFTLSTSWVDLVSVTITTTGRPVVLDLIAEEGFTMAITASSTDLGVRYQRDGANVFLAAGISGALPIITRHVDVVDAGTYTYTLGVASLAGFGVYVEYIRLIAHEL